MFGGPSGLRICSGVTLVILRNLFMVDFTFLSSSFNAITASGESFVVGFVRFGMVILNFLSPTCIVKSTTIYCSTDINNIPKIK